MAEQGTATDFLSPISTILIQQYRWQERCTGPACHHTANAVNIFNEHDVMWICGYERNVLHNWAVILAVLKIAAFVF